MSEINKKKFKIPGEPSATQLAARAAAVGGTTPTAPKPTLPTDPSRPVTAPSPIQTEMAGRVERPTEEGLRGKLFEAVKTKEAFKEEARGAELRREAGVAGIQERIGTFQEEHKKTSDLLDQLESDIKLRTGQFLVPEAARRRILAVERAPLIKQLGITEENLTKLETKLGAVEDDIITQLELEKEAAETPLETLKSELDAVEKINKIFEEEEVKEKVTTGDLRQFLDAKETGAIPEETSFLEFVGQLAGAKRRPVVEKAEEDKDLLKTGTTKDVNEEVRKTFAPEFKNKVINELNTEQLREFMVDYRNTTENLQQSIDPNTFLKAWKEEVGIKKGEDVTEEITDEQLTQLIDKGLSDDEIIKAIEQGLSFEEILLR